MEILDVSEAPGNFWRCVYSKVDSSPELNAVRDEALNAFPTTLEAYLCMPETPYFPHMSLVYGDAKDVSEEKRLEVTARLKGQVTKGWSSRWISLWDCSGPPNTWIRLHTSTFKGDR